MAGAKILIVEDEGIEALDIQYRLRSLGYPEPEFVFSGEEALRRIEEAPPDLVLMDIMLHSEFDGVATAGQIKARFDIPVIYLTAYADEETLQRAKITEPYGYIIKPFHERELHTTINMALYKHRMEQKLRESEEWFSTTLKSIGDAVIATDRNGLITFMNPVAERLTGWSLAEVAHKPLTLVFNIINMHTRTPAENPAARVLQEGVTVGLANHTLLVARDGREIPIDDSAAPIKNNQGALIGVVLVFRDITERQQAVQALRESEVRYRALAEQLGEMNTRKNEFIAMLSHELRNPLGSIRNSLSILEQTEPGGEQARRAQAVLGRQVGQLTRLVDDLLDVTRITQGRVRLQPQRLELNELVRQTVEDHRALFERSGVRLEATLAPEPVCLHADRARLVQVVGNLLVNAAKFTGSGGVTRVVTERDALQRQAIIRVADTGIGMPPEVLARLFQPFMQADDTLDRTRGGLGLGLALSKGLIELHGGDISAFSRGVGEGSEFTIRLPLAAEEDLPAEPESAPVQACHRSRRVLIVDDYVDIAETLRELLELDGHTVAVAHGGPEGIAKAREFQPEVLLCDIGLPHMSGYDVARAFRNDDALRSISLVALTGYASPQDLRRTADAGFDHHLAKPVDMEELCELLARLPDRQG